MSLKLYEITNKYAAILDRFREAEDESELAKVGDMLAAVEDALEDKLENCGRVYRALEAEAAIFEAEAKRLKTKQYMLENRAQRLKDYIGLCLGRGRNMKTELFNFTWRESSCVEVADFERLPEKYLRKKTTVEPNKEAIAEDLKADDTLVIEGCKLVKRLNLQIR